VGLKRKNEPQKRKKRVARKKKKKKAKNHGVIKKTGVVAENPKALQREGESRQSRKSGARKDPLRGESGLDARKPLGGPALRGKSRLRRPAKKVEKGGKKNWAKVKEQTLGPAEERVHGIKEKAKKEKRERKKISGE